MSTWVHPCIGRVNVCHLFSFLCCIFGLFVFILCLVSNVASGLSILNCPSSSLSPVHIPGRETFFFAGWNKMCLYMLNTNCMNLNTFIVTNWMKEQNVLKKRCSKFLILTGLKIFKNLAYQVLKCKFFRLTEFAIVLIKLQRKFNTFF